MANVYSMTGYGRSIYVTDELRLKVEIRSLNNRYLDLNFRMPKLLFSLEDKMRSLISSTIERGKLDVYIELRRYGDQESQLTVKEGLLEQYLSIFHDLYLQGRLGSLPNPTTLASLPDLFELEDVSDLAQIEAPLLQTLKEALTGLKSMREIEGQHLKENILQKAHKLRENKEEVDSLRSEILLLYRDGMKKRIQEVLTNEDLLSEERLEIELAIYAERKDIEEEIQRIDSHLNQLEMILTEGGSVGRKLDFLAQELIREINTIGSKSAGYPISQQVIEMKSLLEQIREQVQNLE